MKVSLITVSFNSEGTIEQTIRSVIGQTYFPNIEYIMIDGGSTDRTLDIIKEYKILQLYDEDVDVFED